MSTLDQRIKSLGTASCEEDYVNLIDELKTTNLTFNPNLLVDLLSERHPLYKERGSITSQRMRGYLIGAFYEIGTPSKALPYLLEELETSFYPYIVAASARAIRGLQEPHAGISSFLNKSIYNIWQGDAFVNYSSYQVPYKEQEAQTTALWELFESITWMGEKAKYILPDLQHLESSLSEYLNLDNKARLFSCIEKLESLDDTDDSCCTIPMEMYSSADARDTVQKEIDLSMIMLEDQDGGIFRWNDYFKDKYTVLSFFYTRCHNPRKCIQTIYNLVDTQKAIQQSLALETVQTAAISYDPEFDKPGVLKQYGNNRLFKFTDGNKMFRVIEGWELLVDYLNIGVNYKGDNVNVHRIEVYIINPEGKIEKSFLRFQAKSDVIIAELNVLLHPNSIGKKNKNHKPQVSIFNRMSTLIFPTLVAFFPKCPICWASYINLIGLGGVVSIRHQPWLIYVFIGLILINLFNLYRLGKKRNGMLPFFLALIGSIVLGLNYWLQFGDTYLIMGFALNLIATLLNSLSFRKYHHLERLLNDKWLKLKYN